MKTLAKAMLVATLALGLVASPVPAAADDDDRKTRRGSCSGSATYRMTVVELDDDDRLRVRFIVNANRPDKTWRVRVRRNGNLVAKGTRTTNRYGNFRYAKRIRGDDDDFVRVRAIAPNGQVCTRGFRLDD